MVWADFVISNSEVGAGAFSIAPLVVVQVCRNGMGMATHDIRRTHLGARIDAALQYGPSRVDRVLFTPGISPLLCLLGGDRSVYWLTYDTDCAAWVIGVRPPAGTAQIVHGTGCDHRGRGHTRRWTLCHDSRMLPPKNASGIPKAVVDMFDVPVQVRHSSPLIPGYRPRPATLDNAHAPWPTPGNIAPTGLYLVTTTWRDVVDAAISVGRDPTAWLATVPALATSELIARRSPLIAYLGRTASGSNHGYGLGVVPNVVYRQGTETSARTAFGYRIGMTMAEWACRGLMGLGPTTHAEAVTPVNAGPAWPAAKSLPDLVGYHSNHPSRWLVEAKGQRKLTRRALLKGTRQLSTPGLLDGEHMRVLCGTSLEHRLSMTIDVEHVKPDGESRSQPIACNPETDDNALLALARSRMLLYLCLSTISASDRRILPVGFGVTDRAGRAPGGNVTLLENDASTRSERSAARNQARYGSRPGTERYDMLTGRVPGTDLIIGMSRRLFAACRHLATVEQQIARIVDHERPAPDADEIESLNDQQYAVLNEERLQIYRAQERRLTRTTADRTRAAFANGQQQTWDTLLGQSTPTRFTCPGGFLEAATTDTYLALQVQTATR